MCRESRQEAKKCYKLFLANRILEENFFFNFQADILLVRPCSVNQLKFFLDGVENKNRIERLALPGPRLYETPRTLQRQQQALFLFSKLRKLVFHDEVGIWAAHEGPCANDLCCMLGLEKFHILPQRQYLSVNNSPLLRYEGHAEDFVRRYLAAQREHNKEFEWQVPEFLYKGLCSGDSLRDFFCDDTPATVPGLKKLKSWN